MQSNLRSSRRSRCRDGDGSFGIRCDVADVIVTCAQMRALEERAFADGVSAEELMEEAGEQIAAAVQQFLPAPGRCVVFFGKGHNGGDALVAARHLAAAGWLLDLHAVFESEWSDLARKKHGELQAQRNHLRTGSSGSSSRTAAPVVVLDGLLGIGAGGALREPVLSAACEINRLRREANAQVFAIDLPTGVDGDTGEADENAVVADFTLTIGFCKAGLLADSATTFVGRLAVLPLAGLQAPGGGAGQDAVVATAPELASLLPRRRFDVHKGECGRVGIVAGSRGLSGAAIMAAEACVRGGAGLVSLYVSEDIHAIVAAATSPEVMVKPVSSYLDVLDTRRDVLAVGPGLGQSRPEEALELIRRAEQPMIIDADGLNVLARSIDTLGHCAGPRLLTPHPGEMARLDPDSGSRTRRETAEAFVERWPHTLLFKGARTIVATRGRPLAFNPTGSPGMATGGMGDVLTGVLAALIAQGVDLHDAARLGAWLCGRAAELAIFNGPESEESLSALGLLKYLGGAFHELRANCF